ncbi:hypothetical protein GCM10010425_64740 [Streptomyces spororaveus]|uniref:DUF488 domain-containing protein n=1 Tax=Streptomyces spororaveus TaxID=284039 RepID=A0ABQ3T6Q5_9ACTN|nr:hypothetical protein Sspor_16400 [Streptomyces spororaveus]
MGAAPGRLPQTAAGLARQGMAQRVLPRHAAHTRSPEFVTAMDALMHQAGLERTAVMCSEAVWWRCHRRLIADFSLLARGMLVHHLMHDGRLTAHHPTPGLALRSDGLLVYDDAGSVPP